MTETAQPKFTALAPLRHACAACGHCCHGHRVRLEDDDERALIVEQALALGIDEPIIEGSLRTTGSGACVFLDERQLCRIHSAFGGDKKPRVCRQYPLRVGITERGFRIGIDPGCTNNHRVWKDGPVIAAVPLVQPHDNHRADDGVERRLLQLATTDGMTISGMLRQLARASGATLRTSEDDLPDGFAQRLAARLKAQNLARFLAVPAVGDGIRECLGHLPAFIATLDDATLEWPGRLDAASDAFAIEVVKRHLFLRLGDEPLPDAGQVALMLAGAVACAWADPRPDSFGPAMSGWAKAMRHRAFWAGLVPRPETLMWLMTGLQADSAAP